MKEYCLYIRQYNGRPYTIDVCNSIEKVKTTLYNIIQTEEERQRPYFVDNDFFDGHTDMHSLVGCSALAGTAIGL